MKKFSEIKDIKARFERGEITADQIDGETQEAIALLMEQEIESELKEIERNKKEIDRTRENIERVRDEIENVEKESEECMQEIEEYKNKIKALKSNKAFNELLNEEDDEE